MIFSIQSCTAVFFLFSGSQVLINVKLEREDDEEVSPHVVAPFFPQVRTL